MTLAPIALFVYNRPRHARRTVEALQKNPLAEKSKLFIFSDGPKRIRDRRKVKQVRNYIQTVQGFSDLQIVEHARNLGLAKSILHGVSEVLSNYEKIIVLEDDILVSRYFPCRHANLLRKNTVLISVRKGNAYEIPLRKV